MNLLIVDDDVDLLKLLRLNLEAKGHTVTTRHCGLGVVNLLAGWDDGADRPDLCVLDNFMPEISGMAILNLAARTSSARHVPIIFHSANSNLAEEVAQSGHPNVRFVTKGHVSDVVALVEHYVANGSFPPLERTLT